MLMRHPILAALFVLCFTRGLCAQQQPDPLTAILDHWEARQSACRTAHYKLSGESLMPQYSRTDPDNQEQFPDHDHRSGERIELHFDFAGKRARRQGTSELYFHNEKKFIPEYLVDLFDGQEYQNYTPHVENKAIGREVRKYDPELRLYVTQQRWVFFRHFEIPVLQHHGFVPVEILTVNLQPCKLERACYSLIPFDTVEGVVVVRYKNEKQPNRYRDFYVDRERGNEIVKEKYFIDGKTASTTEITLKNSANGWMPASWVSTTRNERKEIDDRLTIEITESDLNQAFDKVQFHITPQPGMIIYDRETNKRYIQGKPGEPHGEIPKPSGEPQVLN